MYSSVCLYTVSVLHFLSSLYLSICVLRPPTLSEWRSSIGVFRSPLFIPFFSFLFQMKLLATLLNTKQSISFQSSVSYVTQFQLKTIEPDSLCRRSSEGKWRWSIPLLNVTDGGVLVRVFVSGQRILSMSSSF